MREIPRPEVRAQARQTVHAKEIEKSVRRLSWRLPALQAGARPVSQPSAPAGLLSRLPMIAVEREGTAGRS
jgi:hypothetical protein